MCNRKHPPTVRRITSGSNICQTLTHKSRIHVGSLCDISESEHELTTVLTVISLILNPTFGKLYSQVSNDQNKKDIPASPIQNIYVLMVSNSWPFAGFSVCPGCLTGDPKANPFSHADIMFKPLNLKKSGQKFCYKYKIPILNQN